MTRQADVQHSMQKMEAERNVERSSSMRTYDEAAVKEKMTKLRSEVAQKKAAENARVAEIESRVVSDNDVQLLADTLNITRASATYKLQEKNGDLVALLREVARLPKIKRIEEVIR